MIDRRTVHQVRVSNVKRVVAPRQASTEGPTTDEPNRQDKTDGQDLLLCLTPTTGDDSPVTLVGESGATRRSLFDIGTSSEFRVGTINRQAAEQLARDRGPDQWSANNKCCTED